MNNSDIFFISGHLDLSNSEFLEHYQPQIDNALKKNSSFVIGDAKGADNLAQIYLLGKTENVTVYHMFEKPRNNAGFNTKGGFLSDSARDKQMTLESSHDIAWVRPGREKSGTQNNLARRSKLNKT